MTEQELYLKYQHHQAELMRYKIICIVGIYQNMKAAGDYSNS